MVEMAASIRETSRRLKLARACGGVFIDALTALQVEERAGMTPAQIGAQFAARAPKAARARRRTPGVIRRRMGHPPRPALHAAPDRARRGHLASR